MYSRSYFDTVWMRLRSIVKTIDMDLLPQAITVGTHRYECLLNSSMLVDQKCMYDTFGKLFDYTNVTDSTPCISGLRIAEDGELLLKGIYNKANGTVTAVDDNNTVFRMFNLINGSSTGSLLPDFAYLVDTVLMDDCQKEFRGILKDVWNQVATLSNTSMAQQNILQFEECGIYNILDIFNTTAVTDSDDGSGAAALALFAKIAVVAALLFGASVVGYITSYKNVEEGHINVEEGHINVEEGHIKVHQSNWYGYIGEYFFNNPLTRYMGDYFYVNLICGNDYDSPPSGVVPFDGHDGVWS